MFTLAGEDRDAREQLGEDAPEGPHVDGGCVGDPKNNLRSTVEPRLNVGVNLLVGEARGSEVDDLNTRLVGALQEDVFGLQITVDDLFVSEVLQGLQNLNGEPPN